MTYGKPFAEPAELHDFIARLDADIRALVEATAGPSYEIDDEGVVRVIPPPREEQQP